MKVLKRRHSTNDFRFTVKARDLDCKKAIIEKLNEAEDHEIKVRQRKYRLSCGLYFACSQKNWQRFYRQIKYLCRPEQAVTCPCPAWLSKTILENLRAAAANGNVSRARAQKASQILTAVK